MSGVATMAPSLPSSGDKNSNAASSVVTPHRYVHVECVDIERGRAAIRGDGRRRLKTKPAKLRQQHPRRCMRAQQPLRIQQRHPARFDRKALMHLENFLADIRGIDMDFEEAGIGLARQRGKCPAQPERRRQRRARCRGPPHRCSARRAPRAIAHRTTPAATRLTVERVSSTGAHAWNSRTTSPR